MSEVVLALDPGKDWATALFIERELVDAAFRELAVIARDVDVLVVEFPVIRPNGDAAPNTIVRLAWNAGIIAGQIDARMIVEVPTVSVPKSIVKARVRAVLNEEELWNLDAALESAPAGKQHNVYDAVRHGLVHFGRLRA